MRTITALITAALITLGLVPTATAYDTPAVFVVAHQDDEALTFASGIVQHVDAGQRVIVVVATDGGAAHVPHVDKYLGRDATPEEITAHRDFEFGWTVNNMGAEWVIPPVRGRDGQLGDDGADRVMQWVLNTYGADARVKTHSMYDTHDDHAALGRSLQRLHDTQGTDARFYIPPHKVAQIGGASAIPARLYEARRPMKDNHWAAYELWAPDKAYNRYWAVPSGAVKSLIRKHKADPLTYSHRPL